MSCPTMDSIGGAERFALSVVTGLAERGNQVGLVAGVGGLDAKLGHVHHERYLLPAPTRSAVRLPGVLLKMRTAIARFRPDIIHVQNVVHAVLAAAGSRMVPGLRPPPVLATFHGVEPGEYRLAARLFRAADAVACVSDDLLDVLVGADFPSNRAHLVRNGIDIPAPLACGRLDELDVDLGLAVGDAGRRVPLVAAVGRLTPQKAHDRFLHAAAWVARRRPDVRFVIVGDGEQREQLRALSRELGMTDKVVFTLFRDDARDIIGRADLVVFSSRWEGLSIAALEALASGTPVVSTASQGMRSLLSSGAGEVTDGDTEALGRAILALLEDDDRRAAMAVEGRRLATGAFSLPTMLDTYGQLYEQLVSARVSTPAHAATVEDAP